jgi:acetyltransferase-like isoleucine patch superfamily enzyme
LHLGGRLTTWLYTRLLASQFRDFGVGARVSPPFRFYGLNEMSVGDKAFIARDCWVHAVGEETGAAKIVVKANARIGMGATISAARSVVIEEDVLLARNVYISDHAHAYQDTSVPIMSQGVDGIAPVRIGRGSWLGQNVVVLPGVSIGKHCVVGANSVVNKSIPDFSVAVGSPARVIKRHNAEIGTWEKAAAMQEASVG